MFIRAQYEHILSCIIYIIRITAATRTLTYRILIHIRQVSSTYNWLVLSVHICYLHQHKESGLDTDITAQDGKFKKKTGCAIQIKYMRLYD